MQLLEDKYAPITSEIGFLECDAGTAASAYVDWQRPIQLEREVSVRLREVHGGLAAKISALLPLTSIECRRALFLPTAGRWTAYLDNGWRGTDAYSGVSYLCQLIGCRGVRAVSAPQTMSKTPSGEFGRYGATIFELYASSRDGCPFLNTQRSVSVTNDGGRWRFDVNGEALAFEELEQYKSRRVQDRFSSEMLGRYLSEFGIHFFSADFYDVPEAAYLVDKEGPCAVGLRSFSLDEARAGYRST